MYELEKKIFNVHGAIFFEDNSDVPVLKMASRIQEEFKEMFPEDPQLFALPDDAPEDVPRCIFRNKKNATINLSVNRLDFDAGIKVGADWKNTITIIMSKLINISIQCGIIIKRLGVVSQAYDNGEIISKLNSLVQISDFIDSEEKSISYIHRVNKSDMDINVITSVGMNIYNEEAPQIVAIDVNTSKDYVIGNETLKLNKILMMIADEIGEKMKNVF